MKILYILFQFKVKVFIKNYWLFYQMLIKAYLPNNNILLAVIIYSSVVNIAFTYNSNVCSRICCTTHPFQAFGRPSLLPYMGGSVFILVFRRGVCANAAVYFKAISPMTLPHRFLVSLHIHDTTYSFRISPCPCVHCCRFRDCGTPQRSTLCL